MQSADSVEFSGFLL